MSERSQTEIERLEALLGSEHDPRGRAFVPLADALLGAGESDRAAEVIEAGLAADGGFASAWVVAGRIHGARGDVESASAAFERVVELDGENRVALVALGELAELAGDLEGAVSLFRRALDLEPGDGSLATKVAELESPPEPEPTVEAEPVAEVEPEAAAEPDADPDEIVTRSMGEIYARQGLVAQAVEVFESLAERDPDDASLTARLEELRTEMAAGPAADGEADAELMDIGLLAPEEPSTADEAIISIDVLAPDSGPEVGDAEVP